MFGTGRAQPVHKTGLLNLPAVKGDDNHKFNHVMHDVRSEFSKNIKSYNMAVTAVMNRNLSQALKEAHATIGNLNRSQQSTYKTMCKIIHTQRQRVKENYQLYQQQLRNKKLSAHAPLMIKRRDVPSTQLAPLQHAAQEAASVETTAPVNPLQTSPTLGTSTLPPITSADIEHNTNAIDDPQEVEHEQIPEKAPNKNLSLNNNEEKEQREAITNNQAGISEENQTNALRPYLDFPSRATNKKAFFTASLRPTLPPINEFPVDHESGVHQPPQAAGSKDLRQQSNYFGPVKASYAGSSKGGESSIGLTNDSSDDDTVISAQKATSLRAKIADIERRHIKEFLKKQNLERELKPYEIDTSSSEAATMTTSDEQSTSTKKVNKSIAAERRKLAKLREEHRKAVLNSEDCFSYTQLRDGRFLQGAMAYKRRRFLPPSNRAKHEREQILKSVAVKAEINDEKIGEFFTKIDLPVPTDITKKVLQRRETKSLLNLSDIKPEIVANQVEIEKEKSMVPLTEVSKDITYIRQYVRPADRAEQPTKNTSWNPSY